MFQIGWILVKVMGIGGNWVNSIKIIIDNIREKVEFVWLKVMALGKNFKILK